MNHEIILKDVPSGETRVDIEESWQEKAIWTLKYKSCFADRTAIENLSDRATQK